MRSLPYTPLTALSQSGRAGCRIVTENKPIALRVTESASTLQTELVAIRHALQGATTRSENKILIHTDSRSSILTLQRPTVLDNGTLIADIHQIIESTNKAVIINWAPSHLGDGIPGNDFADVLAIQGTIRDSIEICIPASNQLMRTGKANLHTRWRNQLNVQ